MTSILPFDEPSLSDIYMSDDDDFLSDDSVASVFAINSAMPQNEESSFLIAEMPAQSVSKIQQTQSEIISQAKSKVSNAQKASQRPHQARISFHRSNNSNNRNNKKEHSPENNMYNDSNIRHFIQDPQETPSNAPTTPTKHTSFSRSIESKTEFHRQRRIHLCVICLTFLFLLLGITVAVIGHIASQHSNEPATTFQRGGLKVVPITLPNSTTVATQTPTVSPVAEPTMAPSVFDDAPGLNNVDQVALRNPTLMDVSTLFPTHMPTNIPTMTPTLLPTPVQTPPTPVRTSRPTSVPTRSPMDATVQATLTFVQTTVEPTATPGKKHKGNKRL